MYNYIQQNKTRKPVCLITTHI